MAIAASVRPATMSAPRSPGRQPAKDRKMNQERGARRGAAELSLVVRVISSAAETLSIVLQAHALEASKISPHRLFRAESAARRDSLGGEARIDKQLTSRLDAQPLDRARRRQACRLAISAQERPLAHSRLRRQAGERKVLGEVFGEPNVQVSETLVRRLQRERRAELRLAARPLEEHHQLARDAERKRASEVFFH